MPRRKKAEEEVVIIKLTLAKSIWDKIVSKFPETKQMDKAEAIRYLLYKLL